MPRQLSKRGTAYVLALLLVSQQAGCVAKSRGTAPLAEVQQLKPQDIHGVIAVSHDTVHFDYRANAIRNDSIIAFVDQRPFAIPLTQVESLVVEKTNAGLTILGTLAGLTAVFLIFAAYPMTVL